jgi:hypothetical protein
MKKASMVNKTERKSLVKGIQKESPLLNEYKMKEGYLRSW